MLQKSVSIPIQAGSIHLDGELILPRDSNSIVLFAHGSGSSRFSPRNKFVSSILQQAGIGSLLFDLLTREEDRNYETRFDISLLTQRLISATNWLYQEHTQTFSYGYFGASTGAAAALQAAAKLGNMISSVVSRGGRPDLAGEPALRAVVSPTLLLVGGYDDVVIELNREAYALLACEKKLTIIPGATHLFEEPGTLEQVACAAAGWFERHFAK